MNGTLANYTTFGIGGPAKRIIIARNAGTLAENGRSLILGGGSDVLASDEGYPGDVVINRFDLFCRRGFTVTVGSGLRLPRLCAMLGEHGLSGLEWAIGIPGTVGGAVVMNAGAFGHSFSELVVSADIVRDGAIVSLDREGLGFGYRSSALETGDVVLCATIALKKGDSREIAARHRAYAAARRAAQPAERSAGSVFKNPPGISIGRVIDRLGFKGYRMGGAMVSREHANIIVNTGGATARDVIGIIQTVKRALSSEGVSAQEELIYIGDIS